MALHYHLERRLRFNPTSEFKSLYGWSIVEIDEHSKKVGQDHIPWRWTQYFMATEIVLRDELELKAEIESDDPLVAQDGEVTARRSIHAKLRSGDPRVDRDWGLRTAYRMFGSDREIKDFTLDIYPSDSEDQPEECWCWGIVSYDRNDDFRPETTDDIVGFSLTVKPTMFERYVARIANGTEDQVILAVGRVDGFYSAWSPDIVTRDIKVLCPGDDQGVVMPSGSTLEVPRLRFVGEATLYINASREQAKRPASAEGDDELAIAPLVKPRLSNAGGADASTENLLSQLRLLARWIIGLLVALIAVTLWKR